MVVRLTRVLDCTYRFEEGICNVHPSTTGAGTTSVVLRASVDEAHIVLRVAHFPCRLESEFGCRSRGCRNCHLSVWNIQLKCTATYYLSVPGFAPASTAAGTLLRTGCRPNQIILLCFDAPSRGRGFAGLSEFAEARVGVDKLFKCSIHVPYLTREIVSLDRELRLEDKNSELRVAFERAIGGGD